MDVNLTHTHNLGCCSMLKDGAGDLGLNPDLMQPSCSERLICVKGMQTTSVIRMRAGHLLTSGGCLGGLHQFTPSLKTIVSFWVIPPMCSQYGQCVWNRVNMFRSSWSCTKTTKFAVRGSTGFAFVPICLRPKIQRGKCKG